MKFCIFEWATYQKEHEKTNYFLHCTIVPTAIDNSAVTTKATKGIENGQLLIIRDGKIYNVVGTTVR